MGNFVKHLPTPILVLSCVALMGCVDKSYDLNDIDMTLSTDAVLTLPTSSTSGIYLKNFMDLKEGDVVQYVKDLVTGDSILCVKQKGSASIEDIHIDEIKIKKPDINSIDRSIKLNIPGVSAAKSMEGSGHKSGMRRVTLVIPGVTTVEIPDEEFHYTLQPEDNVTYRIEAAKASNINPDLVSLSHVGIDDATMRVQMTISGFPTWLKCVYMDNLTLTVSDDPELGQCTFNDQERSIEGRTIALTDASNNRIDIVDGKAKVSLNVTLTGIHTGKNFTFQNHEVCLNADMKVDGDFRISTTDIDQAAFDDWVSKEATPEVINEIKESKSLKNIMPQEIQLNGNAAFDKDIVVKTISGELSHDVGTVNPIKLDNMPDFLDNDNVVLDLANPVLMIQATSEIPASATTSMTISSSTAEKAVETKSFALNQTAPGDTALFYMVDSRETPVPDAYNQKATQIEYKANSGTMAGLIRRIPEQVDIAVAPVEMKDVTDFDVTRDYHVSVDYDIYVPFTLGPDFRLVYRSDPETGWAKDVDELEKIDAESIEATANVYSDLPAKLVVDIIPLDTEGNEIPSSVLQVSSVEVKGNATTPISIAIKPVKPYTMNDVLAGKNGAKRLDGISYEARIEDPTDAKMSLKKNVQIKVTDIKVTINGKLTYDAN